jgi:stage V sporulation protein G
MENSSFDCLAVTAVTIFPVDNVTDRTIATASVVINDQLIIRGVRVCQGENGLYVGYPQVSSNGIPRAATFPITRQLREHIENCVLEKYSASVEGEIKKARDSGNYALYHTTVDSDPSAYPDTEILRIGDVEYCMELFNDIKAEHVGNLFTDGDMYIDFEDGHGKRHIYAVKTSKS